MSKAAPVFRIRDRKGRGGSFAVIARVGDEVETTNCPAQRGVITRLARSKFGVGLDGVEVFTVGGKAWYNPLDLCARSSS